MTATDGRCAVTVGGMCVVLQTLIGQLLMLPEWRSRKFHAHRGWPGRRTIGGRLNVKCESRARRGESPILPIRSSPVTPTVLTVFGTRPEAIKVAPLIRGIEASDSLRSRTLVTAQHREMLDQVNDLFGIVPDFDLN